jgi:hypothetical protein
LDDLDREFNLLAASVKRTARVQQDEVKRFLETAPRRRVTSDQKSLVDPMPQMAGGDVTAERESLSRGSGASVDDQYPRCGAVLATHLDAAYTALIAHVDLRCDDYRSLPDNESRSGAVIEMRQLVVGARDLHRSLSWLDAAREPPLDLGTRYLVEQVAARLVSPRAEVTVVAAIDRSYATVTNPLRAVFQLSGAERPEDKLATVVFVPRREQRSGLLHPLIIHELAHAANEQHGLVGRVLQAATKDKGLIATLGKAAKAHADASGDDMSTAIETLGGRLAAWVEEAVCDAVAAQFLGPTYLYSFMTIAGTSDLDAAGEEHPPIRQRIRLLLAQLDELGWQILLANASAEIDGWFRTTAGEIIEYNEIPARFCVNAVTSLAGDIRSVVSSHVGELSFQAKDFTPVCQEIGQLLAAGIPPSQTLERRSIGRSAIILGSWLYAVEAQGGDLDALATAADVPELSRLLPKALQDAALLEAWENR